MPTVIDELVVQVGLDRKKFEEGRRGLDDEINKGRKTLENFGKDVDHQAAKISEVFSTVKRGAVGILAAFIGGEAASFIERVATMDANTMRLARSIGQTTHELSAWQNMIRSVGGDASDATSTFAGLNDAFQSFSMNLALPSRGFNALMQRAGINPFQQQSPNESLMQIVQSIRGESPQMQRFWLNQVPGMNQNMMLLLMELMRSPDKMRNLREEIEKIGVASDESAAAAVELQQRTAALQTSWERFSRVLFPALGTALDLMTSLFESKLGPYVAAAIGGAVAGGTVGSVVPGIGTTVGALAGAAIGIGTVAGAGMRGSSAPAAGVPAPSAGGTWANFMAGLGYLESNYAGGPNRAGASTSKGIFQFTDATAKDAMAAGIPDPRVGTYEQQEAATMAFIRKFEPKAAAALDRGDTATAAALLRERWPSLPGGQQQQSAERYRNWNNIQQGGGPRPPSSNNITIGSINLTSTKADPKEVAEQIPDAVKRYSMLAGINTGLN